VIAAQGDERADQRQPKRERTRGTGRSRYGNLGRNRGLFAAVGSILVEIVSIILA
jgi:hypothetical protein